ncbi:MAG: hypothetical protein IK055_04125 [Lachnospiraceae bacterium]|nr:hypothetical protein [Lachnospiraceae bacterium]
MNIENKQTALDDDAAIYQHLESESSAKSEREKLSELSFKGKMRYLWDYYALKAFLVLLFGGLIVAIIYNFFKPRPDTIAEITVIDSPWSSTAFENYSEYLLKELGLDTVGSEIPISGGYHSGSVEDSTTVATRLYASDIDIMIAPKDVILSYAENGTFYPLDILPDYLATAVSKLDLIGTSLGPDDGMHYYAFGITGTALGKFVDSEGAATYEMYVAICRTSRQERRDKLFGILNIMIGQ